MARQCGQDFQVHTFDQQLYAVAKSIQMSRPEEFGRLVVRLGGFHNMCTYIACVGKIWGDGGLKGMLCDSGLYGPNTTENMLNGKQYHRAVRGLTIVFEALITLQISSFIQWLQCGSNDQNSFDLTKTVEIINTVHAIYTVHTGSIDGSNEGLQQAVSQLIQDISSNFLPFLNQFREIMSA
jgi:hypothetical protein